MNEPISLQEFSLLRGQLESKATIIAVGGGKGGVGKSFFSSSLAIFLGHLGHKTLLVDMDLGAGNVHTCLGEGLPAVGINEFLRNPNLKLEDVKSSTKLPNLDIITGCSEVFDTAAITDDQKSRLMSALYAYPSEFIVLDLSAGTHQSTLDFFLMAQRRIVVVTPEPSSIENAYRFMKASFYRKLKRFEFQLQLGTLTDDLMTERQQLGIRSPGDLLRAIEKRAPQGGERLRNVMDDLQFEIILNQSRSLADVELGPHIKSVCHKYFGVPCHLMGHIEYDNAVWQSLRKKRPLVIEYPYSRLYAQLLSVARRIAGSRYKAKAG